MVKVAVVGSREYKALDKVNDYLDRLKADGLLSEVITGGARGVDKAAEAWAGLNNVPCKVIRPIDPSVKTDYLYRNIEIISLADWVVAFWDGESKGTLFTINYAKARGKKVITFGDR